MNLEKSMLKVRFKIIKGIWLVLKVIKNTMYKSKICNKQVNKTSFF